MGKGSVFKVGDKVRIKSRDDMVEQYWLDEDWDINPQLSLWNYFDKNMKHFCYLLYIIDERFWAITRWITYKTVK